MILSIFTNLLKFLFNYGETFWTTLTAISTSTMAVAIVISAVIAFNTIRENKKIEEEKIDIQRKSLAKNLLLEVRNNNFALDKTKGDLVKLSEKIIKENLKNRVPKLIFIFTKKIVYQTFLNRYLNIDFKNERIIPMLRDYYGEIESIENSIKLYNDTFLKWGNIELIKIDRTLALGTIIMIKNRKLDKDLLKMLEIEADFNLKEKGLTIEFKPLDLKDLDAIIKNGKELGLDKN